MDVVVEAIDKGLHNQEIAQSLEAMRAEAQEQIAAKDQIRNHIFLLPLYQLGKITS